MLFFSVAVLRMIMDSCYTKIAVDSLIVVRFQKFKLQIDKSKEANKYQALTKNVNFVTKCFSDSLGHIFVSVENFNNFD